MTLSTLKLGKLMNIELLYIHNDYGVMINIHFFFFFEFIN